MKYFLYHFLISCTLLSNALYSYCQTINLDIPSAYYMQYHLALKQGTNLDTISVGRFDEKGKATFSLPEIYHSYRGVANLSITSWAMNANVILDGDKTIEVKEDTLNKRLDVISPQNLYFKDAITDQSLIMQKYNNALENYNSQLSYLSLPNTKPLDIQEEYRKYWSTINNNNSYSARMMELLNCLAGLGFSLNLPPDSIIAEQHSFLTDKVDFKFLYKSGFWESAIKVWSQSGVNDDSILLSDTKKMIDRTEENSIERRALITSIIYEFIRHSKDELLVNLGTEYITIPINGTLAPNIEYEKISFLPKQTLLFFYESDCSNCLKELSDLENKYPLLSDEHNNYRIITISADTDKSLNKNNATRFPWKDNICSTKGFNDVNFKNYGVLGTPTIVVIDKEGIVRGRYSQLKEFLP